MTAPVPLNPDGTPNMGSIINGATGIPDGQATIWNTILPKDMQNIGKGIWYGSDTTTQTVTPHTEKILRMPGEGPMGGSDQNYVPGIQGPLGIPGPNGSNSLANEQAVQVKGGKTSSTSDIFASPQQILAEVAALSDPRNPDNLTKFVAIQKALASGPWGTVNVNGVFDGSTQKALVDAMQQWYTLSHGAGVGISFMQYLMGSGNIAQALGGAGTSAGSLAAAAKGPAPLDPARIRGAAQQAAQQALGQGLTGKQLESFVSSFQAQAASSGTSAYESNIGLPDKAMAFVQQSNPGEYKANQQQAFIDTLVNMFAPSASQRPNMTPTPAYNPGQ